MSQICAPAVALSQPTFTKSISCFIAVSAAVFVCYAFPVLHLFFRSCSLLFHSPPQTNMVGITRVLCVGFVQMKNACDLHAKHKHIRCHKASTTGQVSPIDCPFVCMNAWICAKIEAREFVFPEHIQLSLSAYQANFNSNTVDILRICKHICI